jgi:hypothetical protein
MASIIRIKRSEVSGNPSTLAAGELAYSALANNDVNGGDRLYIGIGTETSGNAANHYVIGGKYFTDLLDHTRGNLAASSAIITDADSKINELLVDNLKLDLNTISSTNSNGDINITPNGTGKTSITNLWTNTVYNSALTAGRVVFAGADGILDDSVNFAWDDGNNRLTITGELKTDNIKLDGNVISTTNDNGTLILRPLQVNADTTASQATVKIENTRGLIIPVGSTLQRPDIPETGLIRYNTTISQFEGYNGTSYISIGGVRDVDGNTYIIPELSPGSNENTLYFYTDGTLSMTLDSNSLDVSSNVINTNLTATTASTNSTTGALVVTGGAGIGGQLNVAGAVNKFTGNTGSTSTTTGTVVVTGGAGISENLYVGGNTVLTGSLTVASNGSPQAVDIEATTLNIQSSQAANLGVNTNSAVTYTLTIDAVNAGAGGANMDLNVKSDFTLDATTVSIDSTDNSNLSMTANSASNKTLAIDATNAGAGEAIIAVGSADTDQIVLTTNSASGTVDLNGYLVNIDATTLDANANIVNIDTSGLSDAVNVTTTDTNIKSDTIDIIGKNGTADSTVNVTGQLNVDNIRIDGNTISSVDGSNTLYIDPAPTNDNGGTLVIKGNLQVDGTTTTVNSTIVTIDDPVFVLGGDTTPAADDNKDRGIAYKWHDGTDAKLGFFGYDDSAAEFIFIPDATDTSEVYTGTLGNVAFGNLRLDGAVDSTTTTTGTLKVAGGVGITLQLNVGGATSKFTATTASTSTTTGTVVINGGLGLGGTMYIGNDIIGAGPATSLIDEFTIDGGTY